MSHSEHWHDEHDFDEHDSHWHEDLHESHDHEDFWHDEHDSHWHNDWDHEHWEDHEEYDEFEEEKEFQKLIDLQRVRFDELEDVDVWEIHILSTLSPFKKLYKENTNDIWKEELNKINLTINPKIKILNLKRPIKDIVKTKKNNDVNINDYLPDLDKNTINLLDIENVSNIKGPYCDLIKPKKSFIKLFIELFNKLKFLKKYWKNISNKVSYDISDINYLKILSYFFVIFFIFLWYFFFTKYEIENTIKNIKNIEFSTDVAKLNKDLVNIKSDLIVTDFLLKPVFLFNYFLDNNNINNAKYTLNWTKFLVNYAINLLIIYDWANNLIKQKWPTDVMYSELIKNINPILFNLKSDINNSLLAFLKVKKFENKDFNALFNSKIELVKNINTYTNTFIDNIDVISWILADSKKKTYLIIFQNSDEIRPTWWFMWSVWFIQVFKWKIINFEKKDIYALEWGIKDTFKEPAPEWLSEITKTFSLRDANYYIDIADSSNKIKSFLDKTQYKIDWIVYINQNIILDFLKSFWWIYFKEVGEDVTSDNFSMIMSTLVEAKVTRTHTLATPKQILFDFIDVYFKELKKAWKYPLYIKSIINSIEKKDIMFYSFNDKENDFFKKLWLQKTLDTSNYIDFDYPVFTSISWNKSDRYVDRSFLKEVVKNPDCSFTTNLKVTSKHNFNISQEINIKNFLYNMNLLWKVDLENTLIIQWKQANKQYVRVLVPKNSIVEENDKIKVSDLQDKKEISFYLTTPLLYPVDFNIKYTVLNNECKPYNYLFIKQPWLKEYKLNLVKDWNLIFDWYLDKDYKMNK